MSQARMVGNMAARGAKCRWRRSCKHCRQPSNSKIQRMYRKQAKRREDNQLRKELRQED